MTMNVEAEIRDLKRRVGELEGSFAFLTQQVRSVHKDLLAFQTKMEQFEAKTEQRFDRLEGRFDRLEGRFDRLEGRVDHVETNVRTLLQDEMPKIVASAMREVMRERGPGRQDT